MDFDLCRPPVRRYHGPIIDAHCHFGRPRPTDHMLRAGAQFGVHKWVGICRVTEIRALRERFGDRAEFTVWIDHEQVNAPARFVDTNLRIIEQARRLGARCMKFWYKPEFNQRSSIFFDDPRLDAIFTAIRQAGLPVLVHIADPDIWWTTRYADPRRYETKRFTYRQLTHTLGRFGDLKVLVAHLGGWPENLPFLATLLDAYPNCYFDTSATKWIARELSHQPSDARAFFVRYSDRLLFGTDLVAWPHTDRTHHCSRYWVHRHLYEHHQVARSPIPDPDARGPVYVAGLDLPSLVLRRLYHDNAVKFFGLAPLE